MLLRSIIVLVSSLLIPAGAHAAVIAVPGDVPTIRDAVEAAGPGDTIEVSAGIYNERLRIEELDGLTVVGLASGLGAKPILRPDAGDDGVRVKRSNGVTVSGFRVEGGQYGVRVEDSSNVAIIGNEIDGSRDGIRLKKGAGHLIDGNVITNVTRGRGIRADGSTGVVLSNNTTSGTPQEGIRLVNTPTCLLLGNTVSAGVRDGIRIVRGTNALVDQNDASGNGRSGMRIEKSNGAVVSNNTANTNGEYGIRVKQSPPITSVANLLAAGNVASGNGIADLRVDP